MNGEKRMIGGYEVLASFRIGEYEVALCENKNAPKDEVFLCGYIENTGIAEMLCDCMVSDSFADISTVYGERIAEKAEEVQKETERVLNAVGDDAELSGDDCLPILSSDCIEGKVVVLRGNVLRPEYKRASAQLLLCTGGFGAQANARGRTVFTTRIFDAKQVQCRRDDILGVIGEDKLPDWAEKRLVGLRREQRNTRARCDTRGDR